MDLNRLAMLRAEEQMDAEAWRNPDPEPIEVKVRRDVDGSRLCGKCATKALTARNSSGLCHECWGRISPKKRREWVAAMASQRAAQGAT